MTTLSDLIIVSKQLTRCGVLLGKSVENLDSIWADSNVWQFIIESASSIDVLSFSGFNPSETLNDCDRPQCLLPP